ncbi:hypothetical protein Q4E93_03410 [Flavitalea sp. BT771]|uniref:hypothetical protein n=1 Tax=Flavitalea sp. BT771 TaxID=3063329 RepID=UPI0026E3396E|nr:hypothetical protein [Flavitalea sp. BT771]MDO6429623.1 hypothetical protein [Flavitalea sp. BT771]MDV6218249.1 hypothetical protein [Flavitalea sp. BT771]
MKKFLSLAVFLISLSTIAVAQKGKITSAKAANDKNYTVLNAKESIVIYKYQHPGHSPKEAEKYAPKYFFTTSSSDVLQDLTRSNLKKAFPANHPFHDALDATFKDDKELSSYDDFHKMYKVNWLLKQHS